MRLKLLNHYRRAHSTGRGHIYKRPYILPIFGFLVGLAIVLSLTVLNSSAASRPSDSHVVFLFDGGKRQTLDTQEPTVGDLVKRLPLHLMPQDVVEPSLNTPIVQDNFRVNIYRARPVTVVDGGTKTVTLTAQKSARVVAAQAGITVYPEDNVNFAQGDITSNTIGEQVLIDRATPVELALYGTDVTAHTRVKTVADLLKEKHVTLSPKDTLTPAANTPITPGMTVSVVRNGTQVVTQQESIAPPVQYVDDASLSLGATAVRQPGSAGQQAVTYQIVTQNGVVVSKTIIQQTIITPAVPEIIARGTVVYVAGDHTSLMAAAGISPGDYGYVDYIVSHESGWRVTAANPSGAYGLCQALPGSKMAGAGGDWQGNPITQLRWCNSYALASYGSWAGAYGHWVADHWW
ncbi:MAG TPA: G5 domain-containing protein [Candidatus Saccharimonadales bacterium]|nr:G5 domain-containing protein [Candidatus Saccharimonadales bacterium]